jgi:hypothetical protein
MDNSLFLRVQFKENPVIILGGALAACTIIFGFAMQIFERSIKKEGAIGYQKDYDKFSEVANSMWVMILGITTVGYGDICWLLYGEYYPNFDDCRNLQRN